MLNISRRFVIAMLAIGILVGAATTATVISAGLKPFNLALAQATSSSSSRFSQGIFITPSATQTTANSADIIASVPCPAGYIVTGGGFFISSTDRTALPTPYFSEPNNNVNAQQQGWTAGATTPSSGTATWGIQAWAMCLK
jgi:hypothetical protein